MLADPLIATRTILLESPAVVALVADRVYATPQLPVGHKFPCVRLTHIGSNNYGPVAFRHSMTATVQVDCWAHEHGTVRELGETVLDALQRVPRDGLGVARINPNFETESLDEAAQPPLFRYRADISVKVATMPVPATP